MRDGLLGGDVDIDAAILRGDGQAFVERDGTAVRAAQLTRLCECVQVGASGDRGHAKGLGDFCHLHRGVMLEHLHDGGTTLIGEGSGCYMGHSCSILN